MRRAFWPPPAAGASFDGTASAVTKALRPREKSGADEDRYGIRTARGCGLIRVLGSVLLLCATLCATAEAQEAGLLSITEYRARHPDIDSGARLLFETRRCSALVACANQEAIGRIQDQLRARTRRAGGLANDPLLSSDFRTCRALVDELRL